jgi:phosphoserine phosphatase
MDSILITVTGADNPGITAELMGVLGKAQARMLDVQQVVVGRMLGLSLQVSLSEQSQPVLKDLLFKAHELGVHLDFQMLKDDPRSEESRQRFALTLLAPELKPSALHEVTALLAHHRWNIDTITSLGDKPISCLELILSAPSDSFQTVEAELVKLAGRLSVDIALQKEGLLRRSKRLVVLDMDSTLIQQEIIDELADLHGVKDQVSAITHQAMNGELDFEQSLRARVGLLKGAPESVFVDVRAKIELTEGARRFCKVLKRLGYKMAVISGGFTRVVEPIARELGLDYHFANRLEVKNGVLTGGLVGPIVGPQRKADLVESLAQQEGIDMNQVIAIGDGANDLPMLALAGLGIAFNAKPAVQREASTAINQKSLLSVLHLLGIHGQELSELESQLPSLV